jgi:hypothetical protein
MVARNVDLIIANLLAKLSSPEFSICLHSQLMTTVVGYPASKAILQISRTQPKRVQPNSLQILLSYPDDIEEIEF